MSFLLLVVSHDQRKTKGLGGSWELSWLFELPLLLKKSWHDAGRNVHRRGNVLFTLYLVMFSHFLYFIFPTTALSRELHILTQTFIHTLVASRFTSVSVRIVYVLTDKERHEVVQRDSPEAQYEPNQSILFVQHFSCKNENNSFVKWSTTVVPKMWYRSHHKPGKSPSPATTLIIAPGYGWTLSEEIL